MRPELSQTDDEDDENDVGSTVSHHLKTEPARSVRMSPEMSDKDLADDEAAPAHQADDRIVGTYSH
jgi:hypothetical protein